MEFPLGFIPPQDFDPVVSHVNNFPPGQVLSSPGVSGQPVFDIPHKDVEHISEQIFGFLIPSACLYCFHQVGVKFFHAPDFMQQSVVVGKDFTFIFEVGKGLCLGGN